LQPHPISLRDQDLESLRGRAVRYFHEVRRPVGSGELSRILFEDRAFGDGLAPLLVRTLLARDNRFSETPAGNWKLVHGDRAATRLEDASFCVVDIEATGSDPNCDQIIEIAIVRIEKMKITSRYSTLVQPSIPIPTWIHQLTGIGGPDVEDAPCFDDVASRVIEELSSDVFVAHNVDFDYPFLFGQLRNAGERPQPRPQLCTVRLARHFMPKQPSYRLDVLAEQLGFGVLQHHRAVDDALAAAKILLRLLEDLLHKGYEVLEELFKYGVHPRIARRVAEFHAE
jgi:DNA polymerase III epsilon subunit family exonuclease